MTSLNGTLEARIERWFAQGAAAVGRCQGEDAFLELRAALEAGELRSAEPDAALPTGLAGECVGEAWDSAGVSGIGTMVEMGTGETLSSSTRAYLSGAAVQALEDGVRWCRVEVECADGSLCGAGRGDDAAVVRQRGRVCG
jgi:hypothetical protein